VINELFVVRTDSVFFRLFFEPAMVHDPFVFVINFHTSEQLPSGNNKIYQSLLGRKLILVTFHSSGPGPIQMQSKLWRN
jgi:hypothetical protein